MLKGQYDVLMLYIISAKVSTIPSQNFMETSLLLLNARVCARFARKAIKGNFLCELLHFNLFLITGLIS